MLTKESLIRGNFSLSTPIKCSCGMLDLRNKPRVDWLAQRDGRCDRRGAGSIPRGLKIFAAWVFHGTAWYCAGLSLDVRFLLFALAFSAWRSLDVFAAPCFRDFCSLDVFTLVFSLEVFGAAPCFRLGR